MTKHFLLAAALLVNGGRDLLGQGPAMSLNAFAMRFSREPVSDVEALPLVLRQPLALRLEHVTIGQALRAITARGGLDLSYSRAVVPLERIVSVDVDGAPVAEALRQVLRDLPVELWVSTTGKMALVPIRGDDPGPGSIVGRVTDARAGQGVVGARVSVVATRFSTVTNDSGGFRITDVPPGSYTLNARRIGYVTGTTTVTVVADHEATVELRLDVSASPLDAVVVTGTVAATQVKELSSPITVVTAADIQRRGITQINQLFRGEIPGVFAADYGTNSATQGAPVYTRGSTEVFDVPVLKTYIDGIELANSQFLNEIDPSMIDHIEIVRGPEASTLYGAQAINGVMQIFTKKGHVATPARVQAALGVGSLTGPFGTSVRHQDNVSVTGGTAVLSYNAGATYQHDGRWTRDHWLDVYSGYGSLAIQPIGGPLRVDVTARIGQQNSETGGNEANARAIMDGTMQLVPKLLGVQQDRVALPQRTLGVSLRYTPSPTWQHTLTVGVDRGASGSDRTQFPFFETPSDTLRAVTSWNTRRTTAAYNSALDLRLADRLAANLIVGADYWYYTQNEATNVPGLTSLKRKQDHNTGVFSQLRLGLGDALFLTTGVRVDQGPDLPEDRHHRSVNPRVGVSYVFDAGPLRAKLRSGYGGALKPASPSFKEAITFNANYVQLAAPNLLPERQTGWDGGVDLYAGDRASLSVTHYDQLARDLIYIYFPPGPVFAQQFVNVARVRNKGWELEGTLRLVAGLSARATYSQVESVVDSLAPNDLTGFKVGDALPGVPHHTGSLSLIETTSRLSLEGALSYVGASVNYNPAAFFNEAYPRLGAPDYTNPLVTLPAAYRLALRAGFDVTPRLTLFARCDNLTNRVVLDQGYYASDQLGRTTLFGVQLR
ncbi:MAG TPA: TonB-dependent receptor [Gemmatimonadales bacterium]|jgi:outer membrane receptor protein involved in Fe transport